MDNIRFPQDQGRTKGFGYAEFQDVEQLKSALALNGEVGSLYIFSFLFLVFGKQCD